MKTFPIEVTRTAYASRVIEVKADSHEQAVLIALDGAGNHEFSEHSAEYSVSGETTIEGEVILRRPFTAEEIEKRRSFQMRLTGVFSVPLDSIRGKGDDTLGEILGKCLGGDCPVACVTYGLIGCEGDSLLFRVWAS